MTVAEFSTSETIRITLSAQAVRQWPAALLKGGARVLAPVAQEAKGVEYHELTADAPLPTGLGQGLPHQPQVGVVPPFRADPAYAPK